MTYLRKNLNQSHKLPYFSDFNASLSLILIFEDSCGQ